MQKGNRGRSEPAGGVGKGVEAYPIENIHEEAAFIAYHFHWPHDEIMALEHKDRRRWCDEISKINSKLNEDEDQKDNLFDVFRKG